MTSSHLGTNSHIRARHDANLILQTFRATGLRADNRLPTERQLVIDLGLSRTSVRNALSYLEESGFVTREVGRGTFLLHPEQIARTGLPNLGLTFDLKDVSPLNVMAVRSIIEPPAMVLVAAEATTADFDEMDRCVLGGERATTYEEFESWDLALHRCLIDASHNPLLIKIYSSVEAARQGRLWGDLKRRSDSAKSRHDFQCEHREIIRKVKERNAQSAKDAMRCHLQSIEEGLRHQLSM